MATEPLRHAEHVWGTTVSFDLRVRAGGERPAADALAAAIAWLHEVDRVFSTFRDDSDISRLRRGEVTLGDVDASVAAVLDLCVRARRLTSGWFDAWALGGGVDPTGLTKGWGVARALELVAAPGAGTTAAMVNGGGDIATHGEPEPGRPWSVGVRAPDAADVLAFAVELAGGASIATSGTYERGAHIVDPFTRQPVAEGAFASVSVVGPELAIADAYATAITAGGVGLLEGLAAEGYAAAVIAHGDTAVVSTTPGFPLRG